MKSPSIAAVLAATVALGCSLDSPTEIDQEIALSRTVKMVPFRANYSATSGDPSTVSCPDGAVPGTNTLAGTATHLGAVTGVSTGCLVLTSQLTADFVSAEIILTAANGDELWFGLDPDIGSHIVVTPQPDGSLPFTNAGGFDITGGTGRFEGATGHVSSFNSGDLANPVSQTTLEGTISSPGSIKWSP